MLDEADHLYGLPLEEFTKARDARARELRKAGEREAADEVAGLRKPTAAAGAVNRLARTRRRELDELLQAGAALREAQQRVLAGEGAELLAEAGRAERAAVDRLIRLADRAPSRAILERVRETLHAAASDDELRAELMAGRVLRERRAAAFSGLATAPARAPARKREDPKGATRGEAAAGDVAERRRSDVAERKRRKDAAERKRRDEADRKRRALLERAREELRERRAEERQAARAAARAERDLERARTQHEKTQDRVADAERRVDELDP